MSIDDLDVDELKEIINGVTVVPKEITIREYIKDPFFKPLYDHGWLVTWPSVVLYKN